MRRGTIILYGLVILVCTSRGVFELLANKKLGYFAQFGALVLIAIVLFNKHFNFRTRLNKISLPQLLFWNVLVLTVASLVLTMTFGSNSFEQAVVVWVPNILNIFFAAVAFQIATEKFEVDCDHRLDRYFSRMIIGISIYVSFLSILQYLGLVDFPGDALFGESIRLSGPLGSKQHLSLVMSILSLILLSIIHRSSSVLAVSAFLVSMLVLVLCFTRIGYVIFFLSVAIWASTNSGRLFLSLGKRKGIIFVLSALALFAIFGNLFYDELQTFIARLNTLESLDGSNVARIDSWRRGVDLFVDDTSLLISNCMGSASQIPKQILGIEASHYESGQIQYLINFGLLPSLLINGIFVGWFLKTKRVGVTKALPLVLMGALMIYMFNEIVPVFVLFPLVAIEQRFSMQAGVRNTRLRRGINVNSVNV